MSEVTLFTRPHLRTGPRVRTPDTLHRRFARTTGATLLVGILALLAVGCGGDIEARMAEVRALQDVGQFSVSIDDLREILAMSPDNSEATYRLGVALVQIGEPSRAVWALEKAAESEAYLVPANLLLASSHFASQNFEASVRSADRVLEVQPDNRMALTMRAKGNLGAHRLEEALEDTERLIEEVPDDFTVRTLHATLLEELGRVEEAEKAHHDLKTLALESGDPALAPRGCIAPAMFAKDTLKDMERAEELYDDCVERFPTNGFVASQAMSFYDRIQKPEKATETIRAAIEAAPENLSLRQALATRLRNAGDPDGAERVLLEAAESFDSAAAWNMLATFHRIQGEPEKALEAIQQVIELAGGGSDLLRFTQADVLIDLGRLDEADAIVAALEEPVYAKLLTGRILMKRGDSAGALKNFEQGIRAWPSNAGARFLAGLAARDLGDTDRAISELREAVRVDKSGTRAAELLSRIHFERGDYAESMRFGRVALKRRGANLKDIYMVGARSLTELEQYDEARKTAKALQDLEGGKIQGTLELAAVERASDGPTAAVKVIEESGLDLTDPANDEVLRALVDHRLAGDQNKAALLAIDAALVAHPDHAAFHDTRGFVLLRQDRRDDARKAYDKAVELDPESAEAQAGLATLAAQAGDLTQAVKLFDRATGLAPGRSSYRYSAAQLALATGDTAGAEMRLREVVRRSPGHAGARNDLAWILAERAEELDYALELIEQAQRLDPSPDFLDTLGWVRFRRGELTAAVDALEEAVSSRAESPSIRYRLGMALSKLGDKERAKEMLEAAIEAGSFPEAADARRELAELEK